MVSSRHGLLTLEMMNLTRGMLKKRKTTFNQDSKLTPGTPCLLLWFRTYPKEECLAVSQQQQRTPS